MIKRKIITITFQLLLLTVFIAPFTSCKKYEEGPVVSLRSKKERIANTWKVEKVLKGGKDVTNDYNDYRFTFSKGGDFTISGTSAFSGATTGTWELVNKSEEIQTFTQGIFAPTETNYTILKLKENEMWLHQGDTEYHLISA